MNIIFEDTLQERRGKSDLCWIMKKYVPLKTNRQKIDITDTDLFRRYVSNDSHVVTVLTEVAEQNLKSRFSMYFLIEEMLNEISYCRNITVIRIIGLFFLKTAKQVVDGIFVTEKKLFQITSQFGTNPVIFLPTHRSYADFILMAYLCFYYNIEIPAVVAAIDFRSMLIFSEILRNCGALFVRRSFGTDKLYSTVFKSYVQTILKMGDAPFEFFIEGTRSRCGKSLMPKLGLLKMATELVVKHEVSDITLIPISISYDRIMEDILFGYEVLGKPKPKESTRGLLQGLKKLDHYGNVYINFGDPISVQRYFREHSDTENDLFPLARTIVCSQQKNSVINCFNILAMVLTNRLYCGNSEPITFQAAVMSVQNLLNLFQTLDAIVSIKGDLNEDIDRVIKIHSHVLSINENNGIEINLLSVSSSAGGDMSNFVSLIILQHYANSCLHFLIDAAMVIAILSQRNPPLTKGELFSSYVLLRSILKDEFVFCELHNYQDFDIMLNQMNILNLIETIGEKIQLIISDNEEIIHFFRCLLQPFLQGCLTICELFCKAHMTSYKENKLEKKDIFEYIEHKIIKNQNYALVYSLSSSLLSSLVSNGFIKVYKSERNDGGGFNVVYSNGRDLQPIVEFLEKLILKPTEDISISVRNQLLKARL